MTTAEVDIGHKILSEKDTGNDNGKTVVNNFLWYPHCRSEIFITLPIL